MLRIKIIAATAVETHNKLKFHMQLQPLMNPSMQHLLLERGIKFVEKNYDFVLWHTDKPPMPFDSTIPTLIVERIASARIGKRKLLQASNVIGFAKSAHYRDLSLDDIPRRVASYHNELIGETMGTERELPLRKSSVLTDDAKKKIFLWYSFASYDTMKIFAKNGESTITRSRPIDISFHGTTTYGQKAVTAHRCACIKELAKLKNCKTSYSDNRTLRGQHYIDSLLNTKIAISPWGLGEKCYRDYEAIFSGALVIKPNTDFVVSWPDIYQSGKYYISCKIDFSDLQEKVDYIRTHWGELTEMRINARKCLLQHRNPIEIARYLANLFKGCAQKL